MFRLKDFDGRRRHREAVLAEVGRLFAEVPPEERPFGPGCDGMPAVEATLRRHFRGDRSNIREAAVVVAATLLVDLIESHLAPEDRSHVTRQILAGDACEPRLQATSLLLAVEAQVRLMAETRSIPDRTKTFYASEIIGALLGYDADRREAIRATATRKAATA